MKQQLKSLFTKFFKFFKTTWRVVASLVLLLGIVLIAGIGALLAWLDTPKGQFFLGSKAQEFANQQIVGTLKIQKIKIFPLGTLRLENIELAPQNGSNIVLLPKASIKVNLSALWAGNLVVSSVELDNANVQLAKTAEGKWNVVEAIAARNPKPADPNAKPLDLQIDQFVLRNCMLSVEGLPVVVGRRQLTLSGGVAIKNPTVTLSKIKFESEGTELEAELKYNSESKEIAATLSKGKVALRDLETYAQLRLEAPLLFSAQASGALSKLVADAQVDAGTAGKVSANLTGNLVSDTPDYALTVNVQKINPGRLGLAAKIEEANVNARLVASGVGFSPYKVDTRLTVFPGSYGKFQFPGGVLEAQATPDFVVLKKAHIEAVGMKVDAKGEARKDQDGVWIPLFNARIRGKYDVHRIDLDAFVNKTAFAAKLLYAQESVKKAGPKGVKAAAPLKVLANVSGDVAPKFKALKFNTAKVTSFGQTVRSERPFIVDIKPEPAIHGLLIRLGKSRVGVNAKFSPDKTFNVYTSFLPLNLADLPVQYLPPDLRLAGVLTGEVHAFGTAQNPMGVWDLRFQKGALARKSFSVQKIDFYTQGSAEDQKIGGNFRGRADSAELRLIASVPRSVLIQRNEQAPLKFWSSLRIQNLADINKWVAPSPDKPLDLQGAMALEVSATGPLENLQGDVKVDAAQLRINKYQPFNISAALNVRPKKSNLNVTLEDAKKNLFKVLAEIVPPVGGAAHYFGVPKDAASLAKTQFKVNAQVCDFEVHNFSTPGSLPIGIVKLIVQAEGTPDTAKADLVFNAQKIGPRRDGTLIVQGQYEKGDANAVVRAFSPGNNSLEATFASKINLAFSQIRKGLDPKSVKFVSKLRASMNDLSLFDGVVPTVSQIGGKLNSEIDASGTFAQPRIKGFLNLENGSAKVASLRSFKKTLIKVKFSESGISLDQLESDIGGKIRASGELANLMEPRKTFRFTASTNDVLLAALRSPSPTVDSKIAIDGEINPEQVVTNVKINEMRVVIPKLESGKSSQSLDRNADIVVQGLPEATVSKKVVQKAPGTRDFVVNLDAPRNVWLEGPDVLIELSSKLKMEKSVDEFLIDGNVSTVRKGRVSFLSKEFTIDQGGVEFKNATAGEGTLDIAASHPVDDVLVRLFVKGRVAKPDIILSSEPALEQFEIVSLLFGSKGSGNAPPQEAVTAGATSLLTSYISSQLQTAFARTVPLAVSLTLPAGENNEGSVEVGRYLLPDLFVSFERKFGADEIGKNANEVKFDYQLSRKWDLEGYYGDGQEGGVDLLWKQRF